MKKTLHPSEVRRDKRMVNFRVRYRARVYGLHRESKKFNSLQKQYKFIFSLSRVFFRCARNNSTTPPPFHHKDSEKSQVSHVFTYHALFVSLLLFSYAISLVGRELLAFPNSVALLCGRESFLCAKTFQTWTFKVDECLLIGANGGGGRIKVLLFVSGWEV